MTDSERKSCDICGVSLGCAEGFVHASLGSLCPRCRDLMQVRDAFDSRLMEIMTLGMRARNVARALEMLDEVNNTWARLDHDGWLDRSVRSSRALILSKNGRHQEALGDLRVVEAGTSFGSDEYVLTKISVARTLQGAGEYREAVEELAPLIASWEGLPVGTVPGLVSVYADVASVAGFSADPSCFHALGAWARKVGMQISSVEASDLHRAASDALAEWNRGHQRFATFANKVQGAPQPIRETIINEYLTSEPIGYLKERARGLLDELAEDRKTDLAEAAKDGEDCEDHEGA